MGRNDFTIRISAGKALFTEPASKISGEYFSYPMPTYASLKGLLVACQRSVVNPKNGKKMSLPIRWYIDEVRILNPIMWETVGVMNPERKDIFSYNYLSDVDYIMKCHFVPIEQRNSAFYAQARRLLKNAISQYGNAYLGSSECPTTIEVLEEGQDESVAGYYDNEDFEMGLMFHSYGVFSGGTTACFWRPVMNNGVVKMVDVTDCPIRQKVYLKDVSIRSERGIHDIIYSPTYHGE